MCSLLILRLNKFSHYSQNFDRVNQEMCDALHRSISNIRVLILALSSQDIWSIEKHYCPTDTLQVRWYGSHKIRHPAGKDCFRGRNTIYRRMGRWYGSHKIMAVKKWYYMQYTFQKLWNSSKIISWNIVKCILCSVLGIWTCLQDAGSSRLWKQQ